MTSEHKSGILADIRPQAGVQSPQVGRNVKTNDRLSTRGHGLWQTLLCPECGEWSAWRVEISSDRDWIQLACSECGRGYYNFPLEVERRLPVKEGAKWNE